MLGSSDQHTCDLCVLVGTTVCANPMSVAMSPYQKPLLQGPKDPAIPPMELTFMETYGPMTQHLWFGDGYIMLGFRFVCAGLL